MYGTLESSTESESIPGSNSDAFEDDVKESAETEADSDAEGSSLKRAQVSPSCSSLAATSSLLNLQVAKPPSLPAGLLGPTTSAAALGNHSTPSSSSHLHHSQIIIHLLNYDWGFSRREVRLFEVKYHLRHCKHTYKLLGFKEKYY